MKIFVVLAFLTVSVHSDLFPIVKPADLNTAAQKAVLDFQALISKGVVVSPPALLKLLDSPLITFPDGTKLNAGIVALPIPFLCNQTGPLLRLTCRLGAADCTYVHNTYSGKCAPSPAPVAGTAQKYGNVFVCNDKKPTGYNFVDLSDKNQCGPLLGTDLDPKLDLAIGQALRKRMEADLCFPISGTPNELNSVGCNTDCRENHQYASGKCSTKNTPTANFTGEVNPDFQCICSL